MKINQSMKRYRITLFGQTPLLMHKDNIAFCEKISAWTKNPENKTLSVAGDDRYPAWTWIGRLYHDGKKVGIDADNIMTMLREGGSKVSTGKGRETFMKQTQSGVVLNCQQFTLQNSSREIKMDSIKNLIGVLDFTKHLDEVERLGFELLIKRARIGRSKHIRVRPMFTEWTAQGDLTVLDESVSGLTEERLNVILKQAGALCGLCDWRPSSGKSGVFGRFTADVTPFE